jgi:hypothetical protein
MEQIPYTIISLASKEYYGWLTTMATSVRHFFPQASMHVVLVNMGEKDGEKLSRIHPKLTYEIETVEFESGKERKCYCTNRRTFLYKKYRDRFPGFLMWLDADSIVRKSCDPLYEHLCSKKNDFDVALFRKGFYGTVRRKGEPIILAGVTVINDTEMARTFINKYDELVDQMSYKMQKMRDRIWWLNQDMLRKRLVSMKLGVRYEYLWKPYYDTENSDPIIWTPTLEDKQTEEFAKEIERIMKICEIPSS